MSSYADEDTCAVSDEFEKPHTSVARIKFPAARQAQIVKGCMEVDEELQPQRVSKLFRIENSNILVVSFAACDLKMLRVALSSFFDMITVSCKTLLEFDENYTSK